MIDYQSSPSSVVNGVQKRDEQTVGSSQSRNPVAEKRAAPDEGVLQTLQWCLTGAILLMIFVCLWMVRMRRSLNDGRTTSTSGTSVETTVFSQAHQNLL